MNEKYMSLALDLARQANGRTSPNPMVGAVIVKDGVIIGQGWHQKAGTPHAEIHALRQAGNNAYNAAMYVTLEPCSHYGRTGPCADAIIAAGVKEVIVGMTDPNPLVSGKGLEKLRQAGITVVEGVLAREAAKLNEVFIKWISTKMPFVIVKTAMSFDGKIATRTGESKWITGDLARQYVHSLRDRYDAILVGIGTVLADDPELTVRMIASGKNPVRIVVDSMARIPLTAKIVNDGQATTIIAVGPDAPWQKVAALRQRNIEVIETPKNSAGLLELKQLFSQLGARGITSILVEGGPTINGSILANNLADKIYCFIAPKIIGGAAAPGPVGGLGAANLNDAMALEEINIGKIGEDLMISAYIMSREGRDVYRTCGRIG